MGHERSLPNQQRTRARGSRERGPGPLLRRLSIVDHLPLVRKTSTLELLGLLVATLSHDYETWWPR